MPLNKKRKIIGMLLYILVMSVIVYFLRPVYLVSLIIVIVPPAILNFTWLKRSRKKILIFSIISVFLFAIPVELTCRLANVWDTQTVFPKLFNLLTIENLIFAFLNMFWVLTFYEYFIDKDREKVLSTRIKQLIILFLIFFFIVFLFYLINPEIITFSYLVMGLIVLIIPEVILFIIYPKILKKVMLPTIFFGLVFFIYEFSAVLIGNWWWPGQYLLPINLFGHVFPLDDVIFWYVLSTPALIVGYEAFVDNRK